MTRRRGWTLHEMLISMTVLSGVMAMAAHVAMEQLRFFRGVGDLATLHGQVGQSSAIAARVLWSVSAAAGEIVVAMDSAIEVRMTIGTAIVCGSAPGRVIVPASTTERGNVLAAYTESPEPGDRVAALFNDSLGLSWLTFRTASSPVSAGSCPGFPSVTATWEISLLEPVVLPVGTPLRFSRPFRLSVYRSSDGRWYLGGKDWNGESQQFNIVQPVAGPLRPYSAEPSRTGLLFVYRDAAGQQLPQPIETSRIASITIVSRAETARPVQVKGLKTGGAAYEDSSAVVLALRNAR